MFGEEPEGVFVDGWGVVAAEDLGDFGVVGLGGAGFVGEVGSVGGFVGGAAAFGVAFFAVFQQGFGGCEGGFGEVGQGLGLAGAPPGDPGVEEGLGMLLRDGGEGVGVVGLYPVAAQVGGVLGADGVADEVLQEEGGAFGGVGAVVEEVDLSVLVQAGEAAVEGEAV